MDVVDAVVVVAGTVGGLGLVVAESAVASAVRSGSLPFDWGW